MKKLFEALKVDNRKMKQMESPPIFLNKISYKAQAGLLEKKQ